MKIVLITHYSTEEVRRQLRLDYKRRMYFFVNRLFGRKFKDTTVRYDDITPWVPATISALEKHTDIELYVISAHTGMKDMLSRFMIGRTHYYFFNTDYSLFLQRILTPKVWTKLEPNKKIVKKLIDEIQPDIINLIGSDGAYYSTTVLGIVDIPIYVSLQTIYSNPDRLKFSNMDPYNLFTELAVLRKEKYYGCQSKKHYQLLRENNNEAIAFGMSFPGEKFPFVPEADKEFDFVTYSQYCTAKKGTFDAIKALAIVKQKYPEIKLNICGIRTPETITIMESLIKENNLSDNVIFNDYFPKQYDLFCHLKKSRIAVLPVKLDDIPGTVKQAMALHIPLVTNATYGTPKLNRHSKCVELAEIDNIEDLAAKMLSVYENIKESNEMADNALSYFEEYFNNPQRDVDKLLDDLKATYNHYRNGTTIPEQLLYNE